MFLNKKDSISTAYGKINKYKPTALLYSTVLRPKQCMKALGTALAKDERGRSLEEGCMDGFQTTISTSSTLQAMCQTEGRFLRKPPFLVWEDTVYPGREYMTVGCEVARHTVSTFLQEEDMSSRDQPALVFLPL